MRPIIFKSMSAWRAVTVLPLCVLIAVAAFADTGLYLGSKAPYQVMQDPSTYEPAPAGFSQIYVETVARHGSRGLSSPSNDLALYSLWLDAQTKGALTKAGRLLGPDLLRIIQANALLGYGVPGITAPGFGSPAPALNLPSPLTIASARVAVALRPSRGQPADSKPASTSASTFETQKANIHFNTDSSSVALLFSRAPPQPSISHP
jgi:hypothetical protein